jgi:hypothetical protein
MKNKLLVLAFTASIFYFASTNINATVIEYTDGTYKTPDGWSVIAEIGPFELQHNSCYLLGVQDVISGTTPADFRIVFHSIYNWLIEDNSFNVYLFDNPSFTGLVWAGYASENSSEWANCSLLGTWSYVDQTKDVVFTTSDPTLLTYIQNGNNFGIGINPQCHFYGSEITVESNAPVPEPTTLLLLGSGLLGLGLSGFRFKRKS